MLHHPPGFSRKVDKNRLGCILSSLRVAAGVAQRNRVDQTNSPPNEFGKRRFRLELHVTAEKLGVVDYDPLPPRA